MVDITREDEIFIRLTELVFTTLGLDCPILSGNMQHHIDYEDKQDDYVQIVISAPSYDIAKWQKTGMIEYNGKFDYALSVNQVGAFNGRSKKSKHWVDKAIEKCCKAIGSEFNAKVSINVGFK